MKLRPQRLRTRLILWHLLMLATVLVIYIAGVSGLVFWQMEGVLKRLAAEDLETVKGLLYFDSNGAVHLREDFHHHAEWKQAAQRLLEVLNPNGTILFRNDLLQDRTLGGPPFPGEGEVGYSPRTETLSDGTSATCLSRKYELQGQIVLIRVAYSHELIWSRLKETLTILLLALPLALAVAAFAAYKVASKALDPIEKMAVEIEQINSERLDARLVIENEEDELGHLARVCNGMLARIEQAFDQLRRFTADASHELRTPLAAMRSIGEVALDLTSDPVEYKEALGSMLEEVNRLTGMIEGLLTLSRADAGQVVIQPTVFPLMELVRQVADLLEVLIEEKRIHFELSGDETACVKADRLTLRQAIINLLHNATKFTPVEGSIEVRVERSTGDTILLSVADSGPGVPPEHASKVFDRFYRVEESRGGENKGAGLGLSIAKWAVDANHGELTVRSELGAGSTFSIRMPSVACNTMQ
ncbi:MAG TPA: ATP-binding protein [Candidatus Dormibacteraeota bacterium]|jgi:heavy metal sensor kinase|nr:ATP-binding protein [Candidatus Dormibacteraeota bacterium]